MYLFFFFFLNLRNSYDNITGQLSINDVYVGSWQPKDFEATTNFLLLLRSGTHRKVRIACA